MTDRPHRVGRPDLDIRDHAPVFIGGNYCTIICQCGWSSRRYSRPADPWHEYRQHKNTFRKPRPTQAGLLPSKEEP